MIDSHRLAWAAGLFDGEGSLTTRGDKDTISLQLAMTCKDTVRRFHTLFKVGTVCEFQARGNSRGGLKFQATGKDAVEIIKLLRPYIYTKSRQADLVLEWGEKCLRPISGRSRNLSDDNTILRSVIADELRELNQRGR